MNGHSRKENARSRQETDPVRIHQESLPQSTLEEAVFGAAFAAVLVPIRQAASCGDDLTTDAHHAFDHGVEAVRFFRLAKWDRQELAERAAQLEAERLKRREGGSA